MAYGPQVNSQNTTRFDPALNCVESLDVYVFLQYTDNTNYAMIEIEIFKKVQGDWMEMLTIIV